MVLAAAWVRRHDTWNLYAVGALNAMHVGWWTGLLHGNTVLRMLFSADFAYVLGDLGWLLAVPSCVAPRVWPTLLVHHGAIACCAPVAFGRPLLMRHLLRCWVVELHSWNHIAARRWQSPLLQRVNKPLFVLLRLVGFPIAWFLYAAERSALSAAVLRLDAPTRYHVPLSLAHLAMYGLMLIWGRQMLLPQRPSEESVRKTKDGPD